MKKSIPCWQLAGFLFTAIAGTFLHFLFALTGQNPVAALFSAVNESIWEHMKLLFFPMLLFAIVQKRFGPETGKFWCVKLAGILLGLGLIPVLYYTYTGILGVNADWFNIIIFFLAAGTAFWLENRLFAKDSPCPISSWVALGLLLGIGVLFFVLTFYPPQIPFFQDPVTGTYGFQR